MALTVLAIPDTLRYGFGDFAELYVDGPGVGPFTYLWSATPADASILDRHAQDTFASPSYTTTYRITRTDALGNAEIGEVVVTVTDGPPPPEPPALDVAPASGELFAGQVGLAYHLAAPLAAAGGTAPYTWAVVGALPPGLTLTPEGATATIGGLPTTPGLYAFDVRVTDAAAAVVTRSYSIRVLAAEVPPGPEPVADIPEPPGRGFNGAGSAWVTASGTASRRDRVATVVREGVGVYFATLRPGSGRSAAEFAAAIGVLSASARLASVRAEDGGWRVRTFDANGAAADANFSIRFARV